MNTTIKKKLQTGFAIIISFIVVLSAIGIYYIVDDKKTIANVEKNTEIVDIYNDIAFQTVRANAAIRGYMLYHQDDMLKNHYSFRESLHIRAEALQQLDSSEQVTTYIEQLSNWESQIDNAIITPLKLGKNALAEENALPILSDGSQQLVTYSKEMASAQAQQIKQQLAEIQSSSNSQLVFVTLLILAVIIGSVIVAKKIGTHINDNILELVGKLNQFATGDLTTRIEAHSKDEFASAAQSFNAMAEKLSTLMKTVKESAKTLAATSEDLTASSVEVSMASQIVADGVQDIAYGVDNQNNRTHEIQEAAVDILQKMNEIKENSEATKQSSGVAKEMADTGQVAIKDVIAQADTITIHSTVLHERLQELHDNTASLTTFVEEAHDLSNQLALLKANPTLQDALSNKYGNDFVIIAEVITKLADQAQDGTGRMATISHSIIEHTGIITEDIKNNLLSAAEGMDKVDVASFVFTDIADSLGYVDDYMDAITKQVTGIFEDVRVVVEELDAIDHIASQSLEYTQNVSSSAEEQTATQQEISAATQQLSERAKTLFEAVAVFKYV